MWSILKTRDILQTALRARGFNAQEIELLAFKKSALYLLPHEEVVVRISRPNVSKIAVESGLGLASWLEEKGFPALRPLRGIPLEPLSIYDSFVTFWHYEKTIDGEVDPEKAGNLLRDFHDLVRDYQGNIQEWHPLRDAGNHLRILSSRNIISEDDLEFLWTWQLHLEGKLKNLQSDLGVFPIHGNSHPGSFLGTRQGMLLSDFDFFAEGPLEWDLVPWAIGPRRYGKERESFLNFQKGYGVDIMNWNGLSDAIFAREFLLTTFRLFCDTGEDLSLEGRKRLAYWKKEDSSLWV